MGERLRLVPLSIREADAYVGRHHRHSATTKGQAKAAIGAAVGDELVGVAIVGRPSAPVYEGEGVCEILRVCTPKQGGHRNACSFLYDPQAVIRWEWPDAA